MSPILLSFGFVLLLLSNYCISVLSDSPEDAKASQANATDEHAVDAWVPPKHISKQFPYYISGFDFDGRPFPIGKWPFRDFIEKGKELDVLDKYVQQMFYRFEHGGKIYHRPGDKGLTDESAGVLDWDDFSLMDYAHSPTLKFLLKHFANFQKIQDSHAYGIWINVNSIAEGFINLAKPTLGTLLERIEIYGTQKSKWMPKILKRIEKDQIPYSYGGTKEWKEFTPVALFG